eukprot:CAMPEP_0172448052 /NCGR_PEP_ID=MMETSP1065-20121228/7151_1 /TAXON_ID=265537 /ORGANISM="Amphiprora paludosa, Strain CCMP125" /LENGTH=484 /DNA_ID=CAMNT_0013199439 /DNA_START=33 /DNA_END=1487 /DNA_ORIENTATION=-
MMLSFATTEWGRYGGAVTGGGAMDDSMSIAGGSVANSQMDDRKKYLLAEKNASFLGPHIYKQISILDNLDIYFQLFVFSTAVETHLSGNPLLGSLDPEETAWQHVLESYPRIQLWPVDRRIQEQEANSNMGPRGPSTEEEFRRVWRERIVGCGRPALKRLTPTCTPRLGFHGEFVWPASSSSTTSTTASSAPKGRPEGVVVARQAILCCSNAAFYIILDYVEPKKTAQPTKPPRNSFPKAIPPDACFAEAVWPHALARHPWKHLQNISIGFNFQRLTLRFRNPDHDFVSQEEYCYILLTSSKLETVALLKELQDVTDGVSVAMDTPTSNQPSRNVVIENDDPIVLDALADAVGNVLGAVLHFQILHQYWKKGERGTVRRLCLVTDSKIYLFDEDYFGDGARAEEMMLQKRQSWGQPIYRVVDEADLTQIVSVEGASLDPCALTIAIRPTSRLYRTHNWRLLCRGREGAERLIDDVRKAMSMATM